MTTSMPDRRAALRPSVVVVGSINVDLVAQVNAQPRPGETVLGSELAVLPGGKGANQAVAAAKLGSQVTILGAVGTDEFADPAMSCLRESGVEVTMVQHVTGATGVALITVSTDGENSIVVVPGANAAVDRALVASWSQTIAGAAVVVLQGEIPTDGIAAAAQATTGRLIINLAPVVAIDPGIVRMANPLVVNEHEGRLAAEILGLDVAGNEERTAEALVAAGVPAVVMTLGERGALLRTPALAQQVPSPVVHAVDTTGAGDAFVGALAHCLAEGHDLADAVAFAVRVGAFAVRSPGAQPSYPQVGDTLPKAPQ